MRWIGIGVVMLAAIVLIAVMARRSNTESVAQLSAEPATQHESAPAAQSFVLHLSTLPNGAHVAIGEHQGTSPMSIELGPLSKALEVRVEKEGFERVTSSIELDRFAVQGDKRVAAVMLALPPLTPEATDEQTNVNTVPQAPAAMPAPAAAPAPVAAPAPARASALLAAREKTRTKPARHAAPPSESASKPAQAPEAPAPPAIPAPVAAEPVPSVVAVAEPSASPPSPAPAAPAATAGPAPAAPAPAAPAPLGAGVLTPMQTARACLARSDSACAVAALEGRARTAQELELLVETYRAMGRTDAVERNMKSYVERFPTERRAAAYSKQLGLPQAP